MFSKEEDLSQKKFNTIDAPEMSINMPATMQGDDVIISHEGNAEILYRGRALGLHFDSLNIRGIACMQKIKRTKKTVQRKTTKVTGVKYLLGLFPINIYATEAVEDKVVCETVLMEAWSCNIRDWYHDIFIYGGEISVGIASYWEELLGNAANQGIILSPKLRRAVFGSIEQKLLEYYRQVKEFAMKQE